MERDLQPYDEACAWVENSKSCKVYVYRDVHNLVIRHVGFYFELQLGDETKKFQVDLGGIQISKSENESVIESTVIFTTREVLTPERLCLAVEINLRTNENEANFLHLLRKMKSQYEKVYNVLVTDQNCRGYVFRHLKTLSDQFKGVTVEAKARKFIEEVANQDLKIKVAAVAAIAGGVLSSVVSSRRS